MHISDPVFFNSLKMTGPITKVRICSHSSAQALYYPDKDYVSLVMLISTSGVPLSTPKRKSQTEWPQFYTQIQPSILTNVSLQGILTGVTVSHRVQVQIYISLKLCKFAFWAYACPPRKQFIILAKYSLHSSGYVGFMSQKSNTR